MPAFLALAIICAFLWGGPEAGALALYAVLVLGGIILVVSIPVLIAAGIGQIWNEGRSVWRGPWYWALTMGPLLSIFTYAALTYHGQ